MQLAQTYPVVIYVIATLDIPEMDFTVMVSFSTTKIFLAPKDSFVIFCCCYHLFTTNAQLAHILAQRMLIVQIQLVLLSANVNLVLLEMDLFAKASFSIIFKSCQIVSNGYVVSRF